MSISETMAHFLVSEAFVHPGHRSICKGLMRTTIKVGNLPDYLEIQAIRDIFIGLSVHILYIEVVPTIAFVHCSWTADLQDIITSLSGHLLKCGTVLTLQLTEGDEDVRRREETRKRNQTPSRTLFVAGFDTSKISETDISFSFSEIARVQKVMIRKNFCFVRFRDVQSSTLVMENFHGKSVLGKVISIEYGMPGGTSSITLSSTMGPSGSNQRRQLNDNLSRKNESYSQASQSSGKRSNARSCESYSQASQNSGKRRDARSCELSENSTSKSGKKSRSRSRDRTQHDTYNKTSSYDRDRHDVPSEFFPSNSKLMGPSHKFQIHTLSDIDLVSASEQSSR
jgi:RNA recognition motif-containing protein